MNMQTEKGYTSSHCRPKVTDEEDHTEIAELATADAVGSLVSSSFSR